MPRRSIVIPFGIVVPSVASGTTSPADIFDAPHHTWRSSPSPASTHTRRTFAASGCCSTRTTRAETTPSTGEPIAIVSSTARPSAVRSAATASTASLSVGSANGPNSLSHERSTFISTPQNCSMKRMSLTYMSRMSVMPCRITAMRSIPKPNAKPLHSSGSTPPARSTSG